MGVIERIVNVTVKDGTFSNPMIPRISRVGFHVARLLWYGWNGFTVNADMKMSCVWITHSLCTQARISSPLQFHAPLTELLGSSMVANGELLAARGGAVFQLW